MSYTTYAFHKTDHNMKLEFQPDGLNGQIYDQAETRASGIGLKRDFRAKKAVLVFRYNSWAWTLANPNDNSYGAETIGPAISKYGDKLRTDAFR
ncbi:hypothetical protein Bca4012_087461 [Brassica carinata]